MVAEGVEDEKQLNFLRDNKCDESQGFLFSAPVSADEFSAWLRKYRADRLPSPARTRVG